MPRTSPPELPRRQLLCLGLGAALGGVGRAMAAPGAPAEVLAALPAARMQGQGTMRFFGLSIYQARLWVGPGFAPERYAAQPFALELQYSRSLDGAEIAKRSLVEMRRVGGFSEAQAQAWLAAMTAAFPNVVDGDRLTGLFQPGAATGFYFNGRSLAAVADPAFGPVFAGIWLANSSSEPGLRRQLIGVGT
jgi:hypothetical protein